jgi:hypothetical protein
VHVWSKHPTVDPVKRDLACDLFLIGLGEDPLSEDHFAPDYECEHERFELPNLLGKCHGESFTDKFPNAVQPSRSQSNTDRSACRVQQLLVLVQPKGSEKFPVQGAAVLLQCRQSRAL